MSTTEKKQAKMKSSRDISIVLIRPGHPGNIGAVARSMANFAFTSLILVEPTCNHLDEEALKRSKHGKFVLEQAKVINKLEEVDADYLIATSGKLGTDYNIPRLPIEPRQLAERLDSLKETKIALIFGPESSGLLNEEVETCDIFVSIPASEAYPILNLSHAVTILLYELFTVTSNQDGVYTPISKKDKEVLKEQVDEILESMDFETEEKKQTQRILWQRLIGKSFLTKREAFALMGFFKKVLRKR
jgi:TrmH family RNA methyltransferase